MSDKSPSEFLHATAVAHETTGLLIVGASGSGKSSLALELVALGARLVADDQVQCAVKDGGLMISAPSALENRIEARGLGLLNAPTAPAIARYVVDLDVPETQRYPERRETVILGERLCLLRRVESSAFASMLWVLMRGGIA